MSAAEHLGEQFAKPDQHGNYAYSKGPTHKYTYYEWCGVEQPPFHAKDDAAASAHVHATFRHPSNPDFDRDGGGLIRHGTDPEDGSELRDHVDSYDALHEDGRPIRGRHVHGTLADPDRPKYHGNAH